MLLARRFVCASFALFVASTFPLAAQVTSIDASLLVQPNIKAQLNLSEPQQANVDELLEQRSNITKEPESPERKIRLAELDQKIEAVLTDDQKKKLANLSPGISFEFRETKWIDVLNWFARQSDRALVINEAPPGSFTYTDTRKYSPLEALDLLNGVLIDRGFALIKRDRLLICVDVSKGIPDSLIPEATIADLPGYGDFELVRVLFPTGGRPIAAISEEIKPLLGKFGTQVSLTQTNRLIVTTEAGRMRAVAATIEQIPIPKKETPPPKPPAPKPEPPSLVAYDVKNIDLKAAGEMLKQLFKDVTISVDEKAERISAFAVPGQQAAIKKTLDILKADAKAEGEPQLETIPFVSDNAELILAQLQSAEPKATITHDERNQRLLVFARPDGQKNVNQVLAKLLGTLQPNADVTPNVQVFTLEHADATEIATSLNKLFPASRINSEPTNNAIMVRGPASDKVEIERLLQKVDAKRPKKNSVVFHDFDTKISEEVLDSLKVVAPEANVSIQNQGRRIMVLAGDEDHQAITPLLTRWREKNNQLGKPTIKVYDVSTEQRNQFLKLKNQLGKNLETIEVVESADNGKLAILATDAQHESIANLMVEIELKLAPAMRQMITYPIDRRLRQRLTSLRDRLAPELRQITIVESGNDEQLTVIATDAEHQSLEKLIAELQKNFPTEPDDELKLYAVKPKLKARFLEQAPNLNQRLGQLRIVNDARPNELVIWAKPAQHAEIKSVLDSIEKQTPEEDDVLKIYSVKAKLKARFEALLPDLPAQIGPIKVVEGSGENELAVWGSPTQHVEIQRLIETLTSQTPTPTRQLTSYIVEHAEASRVESVLMELFPETKILVAEDSQNVMVWADEELQQAIRAAIKNIDVPEAKTSNQRVAYYPLGELDARDIASLIERLLPKMALVVDRDTNSIVAWGTEKQHETLRETTDQIKKQGDKKRSVEVYPCGRRDPSDLRRLMVNLVPDARLVQDTESRMLAAWATTEEHASIQAAMIKLTADAAQGRLVVYPTPTTDADLVINLLRQAVPDAQYADAGRDTKVLAWATETQHQEIADVIDHLEKDPLQGQRILKSFSTRPELTEKIAELISEVAPQAKVIRGDDNRGLVLWATESDLAIATPLIEQLQRDSTGQILEAYVVDRGSAEQLRDFLREGFPQSQSHLSNDETQLFVFAKQENQTAIAAAIKTWQDRVTAAPLPETRVYPLGDASAESIYEAIPDRLKEDASIVQDAQHHALIIQASPEQHERIGGAIKEILANLPPMEKRIAHVYQLQIASPSAARLALRAAIPDADYAVDPTTNSLIATALPGEHEQIKAVIGQMDSQENGTSTPKVYSLKYIDADTARETLSSILPRATLVADDATSSLIATATENEHMTIDTVVSEIDQPRVSDRESKVYKLRVATPESAYAALTTLLRRANFAIDTPSRSLIATASTTEHERIAAVLSQLDQPDTRSIVSKAYKFKIGDPVAAQAALASLVPLANLTVDPSSRSLIATATADEHKQIFEIVTQIDAVVTSDAVSRVYRFKIGDPNAAQAALSALLLKKAKLAVDNGSRSLIATATEEEHATIKAVVEQMDVEQITSVSTKVYSLSVADPNVAKSALQTSMPQATFGADAGTGTLIVTASEKEHASIQQTIETLDQSNSRSQSVQAYVVSNSDVNALYQTLRQTFEKSPGVSLSVDEVNSSIIAMASPSEHRTIASIVARMETPNRRGKTRELEFYNLGDANSESVVAGVNALLEKSIPKPSVSLDAFSNQLIVVATREQHQLIETSLNRLTPERTDVEVFRLSALDPFTVELSIDQLFDGSPDAPIVSSDLDTQQLIVRGNEKQMTMIRDLLVKMGETQFGDQHAGGTSRVIPFGGNGDIDAAIKQLQEVWPRLRRNKIQVFQGQEVNYTPIKTEPLTNDDDGPTNQGKRSSANKQPSIEEPPTDGTIPGNCGDEVDSDEVDSDEVDSDEVDSDEVDSEENVSDRDANHQDHEERSSSDAALSPPTAETNVPGELPPVLIVPGRSSITVSSEDAEALSQVESLLRTLAQRSRSGSNAGNFAVYPLRNAGASKVAKVLSDLFKQMPETNRASLGRVSIVADDRLNAIVTHGRQADRKVMSELLRVLDSDNTNDALANARPEIVPVLYTEADRILKILQSVYKTQLSTGGQRPEVEIPEGVSSDVASVLQQINAATAGPLLTLEVDSVTNSIVVMAPTQLATQVKALIARLDANASTDDSRAVKIIKLRDMNARKLEDSLRDLIRRN